MHFTFKCPRCQGADFSITLDRKTFAPIRAYELIFSCRCGKQLFGEQIEKEYERQYKVFQVAAGRSGDMMLDPQTRVEQDRCEALRRALLYQRQHREEQRRKNLVEAVDVLPHDHPQCCAWTPCPFPRRPNSKYCSRSCLNREARYWRSFDKDPPPAAAAGCRYRGVVLKR